ncbi:MAG: isochorismatase family protein, partial [Candidatus Krumholzibacteria bacterium]|nr:isochorismatase family protein [Candidatus Krumholzibacteria bacterium]
RGAEHGETDHRGPAFDISHAALLILDMQAFFLDEKSHAFVPDSPAIVSRLAGLARRFGAAGRPVIMTRHSNTADNAGMMKEWWDHLLEPGSPETVLEPILEDLSTAVVAKAQYDAFYNTDLEKILRDSGSEQVVATGVMTHLCVEATARSAFVRGFAVFLPADGTATYNRDFHAASLLNLSHGTAAITMCSRLMETEQR